MKRGIDRMYESEAFPACGTLEAKHPDGRDKRIRFEEGPHTYYIDGSSEHVVSVTSVVHQYFRHFDADKVIAGMMRDPEKWRKNKWCGMSVEEIKAKWSSDGKEAAREGTDLHDSIEHFYNLDHYDWRRVEWCMFTQFVRNHPHLRPSRTEWRIFANNLRLAGSVDMLYENMAEPGTFVLVDWKRSKEIRRFGFCRCPRPGGKIQHVKGENGESCEAFGNHPLTYNIPDANYYHYTLQLNVYRWILQTFYHLCIREMFLIILHPNQDEYLKINIKPMEEITGAIMEDRARQVAVELKL